MSYPPSTPNASGSSPAASSMTQVPSHFRVAAKAGTYELLGPKINRGPDGFDAHTLVRHGWAPLSERQDCATAPRDFDGLREWLLGALCRITRTVGWPS